MERRDELVAALQNLRFSPAEHAARIAQGKIDLAWAVGLLVLNAALSLFVLMIFGPTWLTIPLSLLVLVSALPVEGSVILDSTLSKVVLPEPFFPMIPSTSPFSTSNERSRRAQMVWVDARADFPRSTAASRRKGRVAALASCSASVNPTVCSGNRTLGPCCPLPT